VLRLVTARCATPRAAFFQANVAQVVNSSPAIACECPRPIAQLLMTVQAFEGYSAQCDTDQPQDAALHRCLSETTAFARSLFEDTLVEVACIEGLDLGRLKSLLLTLSPARNLHRPSLNTGFRKLTRAAGRLLGQVMTRWARKPAGGIG
jgi:hypothetical protein